MEGIQKSCKLAVYPFEDLEQIKSTKPKKWQGKDRKKFFKKFDRL